MILVGCFLAVTVFIFFLLKKTTITNQQKYPPSRDCDQILGFFTDDSTFYSVAEADKDSTMDSRGAGIYQCYCAKKNPSADICSTYKYDFITGTGLTTAVSLLTVIINIILRTVNIKLISLIGYHTESG